MNKRPLRLALLTLALTLGLAVLPASAAGDRLADLTVRADPELAGTEIALQTRTDARWLFLPSGTDLTALTLRFQGAPARISANGISGTVTSGQPFDLTALFDTPPADGVYPVTLSRSGERLSLRIMVSDSVGSVYLTSADPAEDRLWVEEDKDNKAKGSLVFLRADGSPVYAGDLKQIKGRGNSTWLYPKKPYQIKLEEKADLLEAGETPESTWVLLANYCDETLLHNTITYHMAQTLGMPFTPHCQPVDLYYDGAYRGSYLLAEKTEIGDGRVAIDDLEGAIEDANPQVDDMDELSVVTGVNALGNEIRYVDGLTLPQDYSGGYLLELDFPLRAQAEKSYFTTSAGSYVVVKSPEYVPQAAMEYISGLYQAFEDAVMNGGTHPVTGMDYREYMDLDSLARCFLMLELAQNGDAFQSSTYFYKPAGEEKLYAGPLWDYDSSYGSYLATDFQVTDPVAGQTLLGHALLRIPSFRDALRTAWPELSSLVTDTLLSDSPDCRTGALLSLSGYSRQMAASQAMDHILWPTVTPEGHGAAMDRLETFLTQRHHWLSGQVNDPSWIDLPTRFIDVPAGAWYAGAVAYVLDQGFMNGDTQFLFLPNDTMTRAMAVTILYRMAGEPEVPGEAMFLDVDPDQWYGPAVGWAARMGIAQGYHDHFRPDDFVTRQELVSLFHRFVHLDAPTLQEGSESNLIPLPGPEELLPEIPEIPFPEDLFQDSRYPDAHLVADWARAPFAWALETGIITGESDGTLDPEGSALRCQAAVMIQRLHQALL